MLLSQKESGEVSAVFQKPGLQLKRRASFISHHLPGASKPEDFQPRCLFTYTDDITFRVYRLFNLWKHLSCNLMSHYSSIQKLPVQSAHKTQKSFIFSKDITSLKVENRKYRLIRKIRSQNTAAISSNT